MIRKAKFSRLLTFLLVAVFQITASADFFAQENNLSESPDFKIIVEKTKDGIKLKGEQGTAWKSLSFTINPYNEQAVDEYGMCDLDDLPTDSNSELADFLFTISKTETGIVLVGHRGTYWEELTFTLTNFGKQAIDKNGMANL